MLSGDSLEVAAEEAEESGSVTLTAEGAHNGMGSCSVDITAQAPQPASARPKQEVYLASLAAQELIGSSFITYVISVSVATSSLILARMSSAGGAATAAMAVYVCVG